MMETLGLSSTELILFFILYGVTGVVPLIGALYLLLRRGNAIAPDITPPLRLRRWTAAFFTVMSLAHVWWLLFYICAGDLHSVVYMVLVMVDSVLLFTTFAGMLLAMLQDRRRPFWPLLAAVIPFVGLGTGFMVCPDDLLKLAAAAYIILLYVGFTAYMVAAIRQYGRWLNDNYADLENKRVWLIQVLALVCMLLFILYVFATDMALIWVIHVVDLVLACLLMWRVETLPQLESSPTEAARTATDPDQTEQLLKEHCVATQLYLKHDLTVQQLAQVVGTNRFYLSQYFSRQGITYNAYINNLRIDHFFARYEELAAAGQPIVARQLARESGYRSYSTFSLAFKQRTGQTVTAWMRDNY